MRRRHRDEKITIKDKIRKLMPKLKSKKLSTRIEIIKSLGHFGKDAAFIAEKIIPFVHDKDETLRMYAMQSLVEICRGSPNTVTLVRGTLLKSEDPYVRFRGYWILERVEGPTK